MNFLILLSFLISIKLIVCAAETNDRPIIQDLLVSSKLIEGKKFYLTCQLNSGKLPLYFHWFHFNELIKLNENVAIENSKESSQLIIKEMNFNNSGEYTCKVENSFGLDSKKVHLKLNSKFYLFLCSLLININNVFYFS